MMPWDGGQKKAEGRSKKQERMTIRERKLEKRNTNKGETKRKK